METFTTFLAPRLKMSWRKKKLRMKKRKWKEKRRVKRYEYALFLA